MQEKQNIGSLFDRIASHYDSLNHLLSLNIDRLWRRRAVRQLSQCSAKATTCLDVAIGTADLAIEIARQMPKVSVQGIDLSEQMMQLGQKKVEKLNLSDRISFMLANAQQMPFEAESFDMVTCAYGVRNFANLDEGLKEMHRVLTMGGSLMILEFSYPQNKLIAWLYDLYFSHILPLVGRLVSRDKTAYTYLNRSVKQFVWGESMKKRIEAAGFCSVSYQPLTLGITTIYLATKGYF